MKIKLAEYTNVDWYKMHKLYLEGKTLTDIAKIIGCSFPCVSGNFKKRGLQVFSLSEAGLRSKRLNRGTKGRTRPMIKLNKKRVQLSHYNWCIANDFPVIPNGCIIHHRDNNRHNNKAENLVLLPKGLHTKLHKQYNKIGGI